MFTKMQAFFMGTTTFPGHALHEGFTETNKRRYTGQQPAKKSARGPGDKPLINR